MIIRSSDRQNATMTWAELKREIEKAGVKDGDEIWYIDVSDPEQSDFDKGIIAVLRAGKYGWGIGKERSISINSSRWGEEE